MSPRALLERLRALRLLILDVDGTLTDGRIALDEEGGHLKHFSVKDGISIRNLKAEGLEVGIISHSTRAVAIHKRADMLQVSQCYVGKAPKDEILRTWCQDLQISTPEVAVIGDDTNDLPLFDHCGHSACPSDASPVVQARADLVLSYPGGQGCVREWIDMYFLTAKHWHIL